MVRNNQEVMKKSIIPILFLLLFPFLSRAAITFDVSSDGNYTSQLSTHWSHVVTSTANRILFVGINKVAPAGNTSTVSVVYNGVAMTKVNSVLDFDGTETYYLFYLLNPATGTHNVTATLSAAIGGNNWFGSASSYAGVAQTTPLDASSTAASASNNTTTLPMILTTVAANAWMVGYARAGNVLVAGASTTLRAGYSGGQIKMWDSNMALPSGSNTSQVHWTGASWGGACFASIAPYVTPSARRKVILSP
jgi:hypothetical protein